MLLRLTTMFHFDLAYPAQIATGVPSIIGMSGIGSATAWPAGRCCPD